MPASKPLLAFTAGDPAGIGPEVAVAAMRDPAVRASVKPLAVGPREAFARAGWKEGMTPLLDPGVPWKGNPRRRRPSAEGGRASYEAVRAALRLATRGLVDGIVTAPISKQSWHMAGAKYPDHTDLLQRETRSKKAAMLLAAGELRAVLVTRHIPLNMVSQSLSPGAIADAAELTHFALRSRLGIAKPKIGLCALNPHAGDDGLLGPEEKSLLRPSVHKLRRQGLPIEGPVPADAAWAAHAKGRYDALIALYHDQALIPLKLKAGFGIVNWTIGIPVVRTSPGHGTGFDIAGKAKADPSGMIGAALFAAALCRREGRAPFRLTLGKTKCN